MAKKLTSPADRKPNDPDDPNDPNDPETPSIELELGNNPWIFNMSREGQEDTINFFLILISAEVNTVTIKIKHQSGLAYTVPVQTTGNPRTRTLQCEAKVKFRQSGSITITITVNWKNLDTNKSKDTSFGPIEENVLATDRQPIQVTLGSHNTVNNEILLPIPIQIPSNPIPLSVYANHAVKVNVKCELGALGIIEIDLFRAVRTDPWIAGNQLIFPAKAAPRDLVLTIKDTDYFGETFSTDIKFRTSDITPPEIFIIEPEEDHKFVAEGPISESNSFQVTCRGSVTDIQSGYQENSLSYSIGDRIDIPILVKDGAWQFDFTVANFGFHEVTLTASDNSGNIGSKRLQFEVTPIFKPKSIEELLSPSSYLSELQRFVRGYLTKDSQLNSPAVDADILVKSFKQPFGDIALINSPGASRPNSELLLPIRILRDEIDATNFTPLLEEYLRMAYEQLLRNNGTSLEELRGIKRLKPEELQVIADKLGISENRLSALVDTPSINEINMFEAWLKATFGLPTTVFPSNSSDDHTISNLTSFRRDTLAYQWSKEDAIRSNPDLDPDLIDLADLSVNATQWIDLLEKRRTQLKNQFDNFKQLLRTTLFTETLSTIFSSDELTGLQSLIEKERVGEAVAQELGRFDLDQVMFRRLSTYLTQPDLQLTEFEVNDLAHLFTQLWKVRKQYQTWRNEELQLSTRLWPTQSSSAAWISNSYKRDFHPWRGNARSRIDLENRFSARIRSWHAIQDMQYYAVAETQRVTFPMLRNGLLNISDFQTDQPRLDDLTERWLVDFAATGQSQVTPIEQAIASLQTLVNGVRNRWFGTGHPAFVWAIRNDDGQGKANKQWAQIDSYARWQAAVLNYLYPENVLYPWMRSNNSDVFETFLKELRKLRPISEAEVNGLLSDTKGKIKPLVEQAYFVPMAIALAFQEAGQYNLALQWYRTVFDYSLPAASRRKVPPLINEPLNQPPTVDFGVQGWATSLEDPHSQAGKSGCQNPYTRFTLFQILRCILSMADSAFAASTIDGRTKARSLYLEASDILEFEELRDLHPINPNQSYLPSPVLASFRSHTESALRKLRQGLSFLGTPMPTDLARNAGNGALSSLIRPTPYRFRVLMDRAKQLTSQAQQLETQYFSAIELGDSEAEKLMTSGFTVDNANQIISLREIQKTEASHGLDLAQQQQIRSRIQRDRYRQWIAAGPNEHEKSQLDNLWAAKTAKDVIAVADSASSVAQAISSAGGLSKIIDSGGSVIALNSVIVAAAITRGVTQGFLNDNETRVQVSGIQAAQERRQQEWQLQSDLADQDILIGNGQIDLANDRVLIAAQESTIAATQLTQAQQMLAFHKDKFTSAKFYQWLIGELSQIYAVFLRLATATAKQAELQWAFEQQESAVGLIKADYWQLAASSAASSTSNSENDKGINPRGITGSARLLQDIYLLDERAFSSERRLLNLTQSFSLANLMPIEFETFRRTGSLTFAIPMQWFDEGFPGHYMRQIKKVRISVAALIPPNLGIRATLANGGFSRVVTADFGYPTVVIRQDPQLVALTSPISATGVFELDQQSELLYPFEGTGVDTTWFFELPPAGNPFDFDSLMDVVISIDYTAQFSPELRDRVMKQLPRQFSGDRAFSIRRDFPDIWYDLNNLNSESASFAIPVSKRNFPPGLTELQIKEIALSARATDGSACTFQAKLSIILPDQSTRVGGTIPSIRGIASSRHAAGASWHKVDNNGVIDNLPTLSNSNIQWQFIISDTSITINPTAPQILQQLKDGKVDDILVVMNFTGIRPAWN